MKHLYSCNKTPYPLRIRHETMLHLQVYRYFGLFCFLEVVKFLFAKTQSVNKHYLCITMYAKSIGLCTAKVQQLFGLCNLLNPTGNRSCWRVAPYGRSLREKDPGNRSCAGQQVCHEDALRSAGAVLWICQSYPPRQ